MTLRTTKGLIVLNVKYRSGYRLSLLLELLLISSVFLQVFINITDTDQTEQ